MSKIKVAVVGVGNCASLLSPTLFETDSAGIIDS